jgi:hypothetical protein
MKVLKLTTELFEEDIGVIHAEFEGITEFGDVLHIL